MSDAVQFTPEEIDVLREVTNVGMGRAGVSLSEVFEERVTLRVPGVTLMTVADMVHRFDALDYPTRLNLVRQSFNGGIVGESLVVFKADAFRHLVDFMGYSRQDAEQQGLQREMLLELSNSLNSACLAGLADQLGIHIELATPSVAGFMQQCQTSADLLSSQQWLTELQGQVLVLNVEFVISEKGFYCENVFLIHADSLVALQQRIRQLLSQ